MARHPSIASLKCNASTTDITLANPSVNPAAVTTGAPQSYLYCFREDGDHQNNFGYIYGKTPSGTTTGLRVYHGTGSAGQLSIAFGMYDGVNGYPNKGSAAASPGYSRSIWSASLITTNGTINASGIHIYTATHLSPSLVEVSSYSPNTNGAVSISLPTDEPHIGNRKGGNRGFNGHIGYVGQFNRVISVAEANDILRRGFDIHDPTLTMLVADGVDYSPVGLAYPTAYAGLDKGVAFPFPLVRAAQKIILIPSITAVTHATSGALTGQSATVAGASTHLAKHVTDGALAGQGSSIAGTASRTAIHGTSGILTGQGAEVAGVSAHVAVHVTSGVLTGQESIIVGSSSLPASAEPPLIGGWNYLGYRKKTHEEIRLEREKLGIIPKRVKKTVRNIVRTGIKRAIAETGQREVPYLEIWLEQQKFDVILQKSIEEKRLAWREAYLSMLSLELALELQRIEAARAIEREIEEEAILLLMMEM